ncbi:tail tape measure protein, partial [Pseudomonas guariconensis]
MTTYMEAVADEATALIPLLKDNGQGFRDFGEQAEKAGRVLSQLEIDRLVEVRQSIVNLQGAFDGASRQLVSGMLPGMEGLADLFDRLSGGGAAEALGQAIGFLAENLNVLAAVMGGKVAAAFVGYIQTIGESASASLQARTANITQAASAVEVAKANQIAAQSAVVRAEKEAIAARGTAVQTQMSIQLAEARLAERAATAQLAAAQAGLKAASGGVLALLGGPAGIAALAVGAGIAFLTMRDNTSTLERKLGDLADPLDKLIERFSKLNRATQAVTLRELQTKIDETQRKLNETTGAIADRFESDLRNLGAAGADGLMAGLAPLPEDVQAA